MEEIRCLLSTVLATVLIPKSALTRFLLLNFSGTTMLQKTSEDFLENGLPRLSIESVINAPRKKFGSLSNDSSPF